MKTILLFTALFAIVAKTPYKQSDDRNWGDWKESSVTGIDFRVAYDYYNNYSAAEGKPANFWCIQIRNRYEAKKYVAWSVSDKGLSPNSPIVLNGKRAACIEAGGYEESCLWANNTPADEQIEIFIWPLQNCPY